MRTIDVLAKTKEEAIAKAMAELNVPMECLEVEVIEEATKGFLGLIGKKECHIRVTELDDTRAEEFATEFLNGLFEVTNTDCSFTCEKDEDGILHINVEGEESSLFIGRRGDTLDALQMLTTLVVNRQLEDYQKIMIDIEDYREKREESLTNYVKKMARQVAKYKRSVKLDPMNPYDRRIAHSVLQGDPYVTTYSEGKDPYRRVVISLKKEKRVPQIAEDPEE